MTVFLTGIMGAGKTTVGALLALRLGVPFTDLDARIEAQAGMRIADIFARDGEAAFREREARALAEAAGGDGVVALGGGALGWPESRDRVRSAGWLVCLTASVEQLARRLGDARDRPLLERRDVRDTLGALLEERLAVYAQADLTVDTTGRAPEDVAEQIARWIASA